MSKALEHLQKLDKEFEASAEGHAHRLRLDLAEILWRRLNELDWTQKRFAEEMRCSPQFANELVHANTNWRTETFGRVVVALGLDLELVVREPVPDEGGEETRGVV